MSKPKTPLVDWKAPDPERDPGLYAGGMRYLVGG